MGKGMVVRFGAFLAFIGFGSSLLHFTDVQFRLVMWAEPFQPLLGLGIGAVGAVICWIAYMFQQRKEAPAAPPAYAPQQPPVYQQPPAYQPQQFAAQPPQQFQPYPPQQLQPYPPQPYQQQYPPQPMPPQQGYPYGQPPR